MKRRSQRRFTEREIREHLINCERSSKDVGEYCIEQGLVRQTFYAWRKKFNSEGKDLKIKENFIPISMSSEKEGSQYFAEVLYPNGKVVRFFSSVNSIVLRDLLK